MKFGVLALDYDGTIARDGILDADVKSAIAEVRAGGIVVILVTGRILDQLRQCVGDLSFVDAVVAENGAVLTLPNGQSRVIGSAPAPVFLEALRCRKIEFTMGQCVVETDGWLAQQVLTVIRELELPLVLLFNRSRLMVLPQSIDKGSGLRQLLTMLRLSAHNMIAIGDGENDHALLAQSAVGVAVEWGSKALQAAADEVLHGDGPSFVAKYIRNAAREVRLPPQKMGRSRLTLGTTEDGHPLTVAVRGRNMLIAGDSKSGKSWLTGLVCEQLILGGYSLCVIDPEGDYRTLDALPGVVVFGSDRTPPDFPDLIRVLQHPDMSVVLDLSHVPYTEKGSYLHTLLSILAAHRRATGLPHWIVIDEAHYFLQEPTFREVLDLDLKAYLFVTYHVSDLHPDLLKVIEDAFVTRTTDPREFQPLCAMAGSQVLESELKCTLGALTLGEAVLFPGMEEAHGCIRKFRMPPRLTVHSRHKAKYLDIPLQQGQAFVFTDNGKPCGRPARTLAEFLLSLNEVPVSVLKGHARRGDFSRWLVDVFHDHSLASAIHKIERRTLDGDIRNLSKHLAQSIQNRY